LVVGWALLGRGGVWSGDEVGRAGAGRAEAMRGGCGDAGWVLVGGVGLSGGWLGLSAVFQDAE